MGQYPTFFNRNKEAIPILKRILTGLIGAAILIFVLIEGRFLLTLGVIAISIISMWEFYRAVGLTNKNKLLCVLGIWGSCAIAILAAYQLSGNPLIRGEFLMLTGFAYIISLFVIMLAKHKSIKLADIALIIIGGVYIAYLITHIILVRNLELGHFLVWLIFLGAFMTDTFAYFTGIFFGKRKLCPEISPKKTIVGAVGGTLGCGLSFVLFGVILQQFQPELSANLPLMFAFGLICALAAQIGDLTASVIKRQYNVKDFGKILPGHGGFLDRFDSILLVAPTVFVFLSHIEVIV